MARNKFATMLHKNWPKTIVILVYAFLEWILILLLLANSLFSHLISKFAAYFGLKPSCSWCSRLDHILCSDSYRERRHVCEAHGAEISKLAYCSNHGRLAESTNLCSNCSSPTPTDELSSAIAWFARVREGAVPEEDGGDQNRQCSCCDEILGGNSLRPPPFVFKPTWDVLNYYCMQKKGSIAEVVDLETTAVDKPLCDEADQKKQEIKMQVQSDFTCESTDCPLSSLGCNEDDDDDDDDDESLYTADMLLQNAEYTDSDRFICIELLNTDAKVDPVEEGDDDEDEQVSSVEIQSEKADLLSTVQNDENKNNSETTEIEGMENSPEKEVGEKHSPGLVVATDSLDNKAIEEIEPVMEDSFEGSIAGKVEAQDESLVTTEQLRIKVRSQQKALNALYAELEEERRAAAEAASQTMAMITKIQEEKAAMQMEALQYQRMMEEQAEYDQEALQLLNDLMVKRDKEKQQLEKELEICLNQVSELLQSGNLNRSNAINYSHSNCEDVLDIPHEQNLADRFEDPEETGAEFTPDFSLAEFDEERLSILDEVKALEAKVLASLNSDEAELSEDGMTKKLLPLFNAADEEEEGVEERKGIVMHEELVHVYERLQALEADKEFLKHCIKSMMKGNKGLPLLHEILQHLRGLRSVEFVTDETPLQNTSNLISDLGTSV